MLDGELAAIRHGSPGGGDRRLVLVHGFTQTARSWDDIARRLPTGYEIVAVDAPGHGGSAGEAQADLTRGARLLGRAGGRATYVGYSMGGRLTLHLALAEPQVVETLVLIGATAGIEDTAERAARRRSDNLMATSIERDGVEPFIERWLAQPLFVTLPPAAANVEDRLRNTAHGLAASLRAAGTGSQEPLWERLGELSMPVLLVVGALDAKFLAVAQRMAARITDATVLTVPDAGHSAHLERPREFVDLLERWLGDHPPSANPTAPSAP